MSVVITRTLMVDFVVRPDETIEHRVPLLKGQRLYVRRDFDEENGRDWLAPMEGGIIPVPPDAWEREVFSRN